MHILAKSLGQLRLQFITSVSIQSYIHRPVSQLLELLVLGLITKKMPIPSNLAFLPQSFQTEEGCSGSVGSSSQNQGRPEEQVQQRADDGGTGN